jgi:hypothetical protein
MSLAIEGEHLALFRQKYIIVTSSTNTRGDIMHEMRLDTATSTNLSETPPNSSTRLVPPPETTERELQQLFEEFRHAVFEDGVDSDFGQRLVQIVENKGNIALLELNALLRVPTTPTNVGAEALRWLGQMRHQETHAFRRWILADFLKAPSVLIRDGAIVGLLNLDDPAVMHAVQAALDTEPSKQLKEDLAQLLEQLQMPERHYALFAQENTQSTVGP